MTGNNTYIALADLMTPPFLAVLLFNTTILSLRSREQAAFRSDSSGLKPTAESNDPRTENSYEAIYRDFFSGLHDCGAHRV
jgi:hypothetical protein